jgi:hypothetical protein
MICLKAVGSREYKSLTLFDRERVIDLIFNGKDIEFEGGL